LSLKSNTARLSIWSNITLIVLNTIVGLISGSVSILSEAIHTLIDLMAAIMAFYSIKIADKPADEDHPFGHGKFENISGVIEALLIFGASGWIIYNAVNRLIDGEQLLSNQGLTLGFLVMMASSLINLIVSRRMYRVAKETDSIALKAGDVLIEIIKPIQGRNGRDCRGKIISIPKVKDFNIPSITVKPNEIKKEEDEKRIVYIARKDGYIYKDGDSYTIKDEMEVKQINLKTGNVSGAKDAHIKLEVKESDALKEAISDNMTVETTVLIVRGNVGKAAKINAQDLKVHGQTHQKATIYADKAFINVHKGYIEGKEIEINRLEGGAVKGKKVKIKQAIGGRVIAEEIEFEIIGSHVKAYALKEIKIKKLKGGENKFIISPLEVLGVENDVEKMEIKIKEIKRDIEIYTKEYKKRKEILIKNKPAIEQLMKTYKENKQKNIKTSYTTIKKIKEYNEYKDKTLEIKNKIALLKKDLEELKETLQNYQNAIFNSVIILHSPWTPYNRIEFDIIEPPVKLKYDTKGSEGVCGFKLKDYGDTFKIVKIKVDDNDSSS
jgi:hypothetical protein